MAQTGALDGEGDDEPDASQNQVQDAWSVARAFFATYVAYLYGRLAATDITGIDQGLRWQLAHGHAIATPTERASRPHIVRLSLTSSGPPISVTAVALVITANREPSRLVATLEPHHRTWIVVATGG